MKENHKNSINLAALFVLCFVVGFFFTDIAGLFSARSTEAPTFDEDLFAVRLAQELEDSAYRIAEEIAAQRGETLFLETKAGFVSIEPETLEGDFVVRVLPKEYRDGATATLTIQGTNVPMEWKDSYLECSVTLPLDTKPEPFRITLKSGDFNQVELMKAAEFGGSYFAGGTEVLNSGGSYINSLSSYAYNDDLDLEVYLNYIFNESLLPLGDKASTVRIYAETEGKEIFSKPMKGNSFAEEQIFQVEREDSSVIIYAEVKGKSGLTYRYFLNYFQFIREDDTELIDHSFLRITTKEGKTVEIPVN